MLTQIEKDRIEKLENEVATLHKEVVMQQIMISGLLHSFFRNESSNQEAFFSVISEELNRLRFGSVKHQEFSHDIQQLLDRYR
ncbi:hypothetical protein AB3X30_27300 [Raoultella terrigena]|uniref:hypothetical protein n=1 Tax=Klebsiella/Raoultella group TaxID=2890311 RepID=UPI0011434286|nr:hypothetical protein [Klebsiella pneumoniae]TYY42174.1 hypothetical protein FCH00_025340 [Klebsiella pneumoniae]